MRRGADARDGVVGGAEAGEVACEGEEGDEGGGEGGDEVSRVGGEGEGCGFDADEDVVVFVLGVSNVCSRAVS